MWPRWYKPQGHAASDVVASTARIFGLTPEELRGSRRNAHIVNARWVAMKALQSRGSLSYPVIGRMLGGKDHTSVIHACNSFDDRARKYPEMLVALARVK